MAPDGGVTSPDFLLLPARKHTGEGKGGGKGTRQESFLQVFYIWKVLLEIWVGLWGRRLRAWNAWSQSTFSVIQLYIHSHSARVVFFPLPIPICVKTRESKTDQTCLGGDSYLSFHVKVYITVLITVYSCTRCLPWSFLEWGQILSTPPWSQRDKSLSFPNNKVDFFAFLQEYTFWSISGSSTD